MAVKLQPTDLSITGRLLLLLARDSLDPEQLLAAQSLVGQIEDWALFLRRCQQHFILPLVLRHLAELPKGCLPDQLRERMCSLAIPVVARTLKIAAAQRHFAEEILDVCGIQHAFVKGQALAALYYREPGSRYCRDVDVLVSPDDLVRLSAYAQEHGYRVYPDQRKLSRRDLAAAARYRPVISLVGNDGILVEVHGALDKTGLLFDNKRLLDSTRLESVHGSKLSVLPLTQHLVFVCVHSTRHLWSHLNWLVDMDAMSRHPDYDETHVLEFAKDCNVENTVEACIELYERCGGTNVDRAVFDENARDLFDALTMHIENGPAVEFELRIDRPLPDFAFRWQASVQYQRRTRIRSRFTKFQPNFQDYEAFPLPMWMHWIYYLTRPISAGFRRKPSGSQSSFND